MLVIHCCLTNYPSLWQFETNLYYLMQFLWSGIWEWLWQRLWPRISHEVAVSVLARTAGLTESWRRSDPGMIYHTWLLAHHQSKQGHMVIAVQSECYKWLTCFKERKK